MNLVPTLATRCRRGWWAWTAGRKATRQAGLDQALENALNQSVHALNAQQTHWLHTQLGAIYLDPSHSDAALLDLCERVEAVNENGLAILSTMLKAGANPNPQDAGDSRERALHKVARYGWAAAVPVLVEHGARLEEVDSAEHTPLLAALDFERLPGDRRVAPRLKTALALLEAGANAQAQTANHQGVLHSLLESIHPFTLGFNNAAVLVTQVLDALEARETDFQELQRASTRPVEAWLRLTCAQTQAGACALAIGQWLKQRPHLFTHLRPSLIAQAPGQGQARVLAELHGLHPTLMTGPSTEGNENVWHGLARNKKATHQSVAFLLEQLPLRLLHQANTEGDTPLDLMDVHWKGSAALMHHHALVRQALMRTLLTSEAQLTARVSRARL